MFDAGEDLTEAVAKTLDVLFSDKSFAIKLAKRWEA